MVDERLDIKNSEDKVKKKQIQAFRRPFYSVDERRLAWLDNEFLNYLKDLHTHANLGELSGNVSPFSNAFTVSTGKGLCIATSSIITLVKERLGIGAKYVLSR